ncbi:hypothetical protein V8F33_007708 [Rhypophila sp. PSN 637]
MGRPSLPLSQAATPKAMSSRLMTMKFMQRGAAVNASASDAASPTTPRTDDEGSASKRRKLSRASAPNTPNTPATPLYDQKAIQAAMEEEDKKRKAAIERRAAELGDSHWVLDGFSASTKTTAPKTLNIVQVGFAQIDSAVVSEENTDSPGGETIPAPARFRQFNMKKAKVCSISDDDSSDSSEDSDQESSQETNDEPDRGRRSSVNDSGRKRARSSLSAKRDKKRRKSQELARERRKKEVNLNKLTSLSAGGPPQDQSPKFGCRICGKPGHKVVDCPRKRK